MTFNLPSALSSHSIIIAFLLDKKMPALKSHFYRFERRKRNALFFFSQGFLSPSPFKNYGLRTISQPPCRYDGILDSEKSTEEWKADHWVHLQRRKLKIYIGFLITYAWTYRPFVYNLVRLFSTVFCFFDRNLDWLQAVDNKLEIEECSRLRHWTGINSLSSMGEFPSWRARNVFHHPVHL